MTQRVTDMKPTKSFNVLAGFSLRFAIIFEKAQARVAIKEQDLLQPPAGPHQHFQALPKKWGHVISTDFASGLTPPIFFEVFFVQYLECVILMLSSGRPLIYLY